MWQGIRRKAMGWTGELHWASTHANSGSVAADIYRLSLACSIYALWHERNVRIFQNQKIEVNILLRRVVQEIHKRGKTIGSIAAKWSRSRSSKAGLQSQSVVSPDSSKPESKIAFTWFGPRPVVLINDAEMVKDIFSKPYIFVKPENYHIIKLLIKGLATANKDIWSRHRKIINPAFHLEKLKIMVPIFYSCCCDMVRKWEKIVTENGSYELDLWPNLEILTSNALSKAAFGSNYEEGKKIFDLQMELSELVMKSFPLPGASLLPTKTNRRVKEIAKQVRSSIQGIITKRLKAMERENAGISYDDLLGVLLESNLRQIKEGVNKNLGMSMEEVIEECEFFYFAGHESTSVLIMWAIILLSKHLDWQEHARQEILQVLGGKNPDFDDLSRLKIVNMILLETLRLYPPGVMFARVLGETTKLGNITLPCGVQVNIPTLFVHRDQEIWGNNANEFNPERFSEGVASSTNGKFGYFPFGFGPRVCIGQNFAMLEAKIALAMFLQHFTFDISPSYVHAPYLVVTLQAQYGAQVILRKVVKSE
ncbi:cytochrome P450 CYP72A219-like [Solanum verrucosum]|uniref:cytochrome P450 CYP72A219-like n=1 Tax=Solanum verrucosum TaxID=315347 RepID=UPI0020D1610A|nr:cytochrome P450 CYP72A219-like [Solanum verrucosum]